MPPMFRFDPDRVATLEAAGWRAYYDRRWVTLLRLTVTLCQEQFHIPFPVSLVAAYHVTRGAIAWAPVQHDLAAVQRWYERFYALARRYSGLHFDPADAAAWEMRYWVDHRRLVDNEDKGAYVASMTQLHSVLFGISLEQARESAELRVAATITVDRITSHRSTDVEGDWAQIDEQLRRCYRSAQHAMNEAAATALGNGVAAAPAPAPYAV